MLFRVVAIGLIAYVLAAAAWVVSAGVVRTRDRDELLNVACDPTRELWRDLNARFQQRHEEATGIRIRIRQSHGGSASQARAVVEGLDADVVSLAMFPDTDAIRKSGRIDEGWIDRLPNRSLPYTSTIVFVVRKGNPKGIRDWPDLVRSDVSIVTPSPKTSGNGKWSFLALWGSVTQHGGNDEQAFEYVKVVYAHAPVLDASARGATMTFAQKKIGDVHLTWENEAYLEVQEAGGALEIVYPPISVRAEPPVAIVDRVVDRKGTRAVAQAYLEFLYTDEAQDIIAYHYHRPTNPDAVARHAGKFPAIPMFAATDLAPNWDAIQAKFFADGAAFDQAMAGTRR